MLNLAKEIVINLWNTTETIHRKLPEVTVSGMTETETVTITANR